MRMSLAVFAVGGQAEARTEDGLLDGADGAHVKGLNLNGLGIGGR